MGRGSFTVINVAVMSASLSQATFEFDGSSLKQKKGFISMYLFAQILMLQTLFVNKSRRGSRTTRGTPGRAYTGPQKLFDCAHCVQTPPSMMP